MERYEMDGSVWDVQRALIVGRQAATRLSIARSRDRDLAWCERELGDVPVRVVGETCHDNPASWAGVLCESLGRDQ